MKEKDDFGGRMKMYEKTEAGRKLMPLLPIVARIDGKNFSKFTRNMERPYDKRLVDVMIEVTKYLLDKTNCLIGYTQSDEITLVWYTNDIKKPNFFDGRIMKMTSVIAAMATAKFITEIIKVFPSKVNELPCFDCRVWNCPTKEEAANAVLWREQDATKNSISMAARKFYQPKDLFNKKAGEMQNMLFEKGINWNDYPNFFKRGTFIQKKKKRKKFTVEELEKLPKKHVARENPQLEIERTEIKTIEMPPFAKVTNRVGVIFGNETPLLKK